MEIIDHIERTIGLSAVDERLLGLIEALDLALNEDAAVAVGLQADNAGGASIGHPPPEDQQGLSEELLELHGLQWSDLVALLIKESVKDWGAFEALNIHTAKMLREGLQVREPLAGFASDVLLGLRVRPCSFVSRTNMPMRDRLFRELIMLTVEKFGVRPTRNYASFERWSGCDVLAAAMARLDRQPAKYESIKRIWMRRPDRKGSQLQREPR